MSEKVLGKGAGADMFYPPAPCQPMAGYSRRAASAAAATRIQQIKEKRFPLPLTAKMEIDVAALTLIDHGDGTMSAAKREVEALLEKLPDECTLEDIQYHLYMLEKIRHGIAAAEAHGGVSQEEAEAHLAKWTTQ